ncbi:hypothetical protein GDO78_022344 [Eleutherodactylus coqui]|uniref:Uncharacterized protein n=1 Tax=Eleutherodactylus coqui TaxID=57060 RepID=A0A8J6AZP8_ELECQ|nr:hypothetical protein GDO78_022344 [Eleutherodactylus coqui]
MEISCHTTHNLCTGVALFLLESSIAFRIMDIPFINRRHHSFTYLNCGRNCYSPLGYYIWRLITSTYKYTPGGILNNYTFLQYFCAFCQKVSVRAHLHGHMCPVYAGIFFMCVKYAVHGKYTCRRVFAVYAQSP